MGDLSKNISRSELACKCGCGYDTVDIELVPMIQGSVDHFQKKYPEKDIRVRINSGNRCEKHNKAEGGGERSQHLWAKAADWVIYDRISRQDVPADEVADYLEEKYPNSHGIGRYRGRTHGDVRAIKARWDNR